MITIISKQNPLVKQLRALKDKKFRRENGTFLAEGEKLIRDCMQSSLKIRRVFAREDYGGEIPVDLLLGREAFDSVCDAVTPQGIAAEVEIPERTLQPPQGSCLVLDGVSDPANVGAMIRTANAAGYREIYLIDCADPYSPKSVRSAMGGVFFVDLMAGSRQEVLQILEGVPLIAADMNGIDIFGYTAPERFALCIGNEGNGLSSEVRARAKETVRIPMGEHTESLNAAVSAGILMYELKRKTF